jgi:hypothetical protein
MTGISMREVLEKAKERKAVRRSLSWIFSIGIYTWVQMSEAVCLSRSPLRCMIKWLKKFLMAMITSLYHHQVTGLQSLCVGDFSSNSNYLSKSGADRFVMFAMLHLCLTIAPHNKLGGDGTSARRMTRYISVS